ncbi:MAG: hypothetical protein Q8Q20_04540 [bacterium]|nr:hypothetical protein [bacterium]
MTAQSFRYEVAGEEEHGNGLGFGVLPSAVPLKPDEWARLEELGRLSYSVLKKGNALLAESIERPQQATDWLARLFLASVSPEHRSLAAQLSVEASHRSAPFVRMFRLDVLPDFTVSEIQCPGSGWPFGLKLEELYLIAADQSPTLSAYARWIGGNRAVWWLYNESFSGAVSHMVSRCRSVGLDVLCQSDGEFSPEDTAVSAIIKRPPLPDLLSRPAGRKLAERWLEGRVEIDPMPCQVPETKFLLALLHDPRTRDRFTDEERSLANPTHLIVSADQPVEVRNGNGLVTVPFSRLAEMKAHCVVKYGGARAWDRFGGHAVYCLAKEKPRDRRAVLARALQEWHHDEEGWILQPAVLEKRLFPGGEANEYFVWRPGYSVSQSGEVSLVNAQINTRPSWKVHGATDSRFGLGALFGS